MKKIIARLDIILPILLMAAWFLTMKSVVSNMAYTTFAMVVMLYFFPVKLITTIVDKTLDVRRKLIYMVFYYVFATLIGISMVMLYIPDITAVRSAAGILGIVLMICFCYLNIIKGENKISTLSLLFGFFSSVVLFL